MSAFSDAIDQACDARAAELGRDLGTDDVAEVEDRLYQAWVRAGRFDELAAYALDEFELQDGEAFCASLGNALCKANHMSLAVRLFQGLAVAREAAFWRVWSDARRGRIGAMKEASVHSANAMKALAELYRCHAAVDDARGMQDVQADMLRLQERVKRGG